MVTLRDKRFRVSRSVDASLDSVWLILTDTHLWALWGPSVTAVESGDRYIRAGTTGRVKTALFFWLSFVITTYVDNRSWRWAVGKLQATGHTVEQGADGTTVVSFDMPLWAFFYIPICWLALRRIDSLARQQSS
ncbi:SRPBCC family protein [Desulfopila aestuarii]|uniref:Polyketide cyclase / dehydrase and lipid transport n=1 Tax=Desulfopila aestuarii DSM 18488 TaxID=1121416 RepID=A0A1M7YIX5_9BACT|nr:SRPBCC family protein [Desulfopila aestuarii]SHO52566.1 Polyketide cyclase / dehydrase and lipid transport [Desulfopila aestuarii DSM 18488]